MILIYAIDSKQSIWAYKLKCEYKSSGQVHFPQKVPHDIRKYTLPKWHAHATKSYWKHNLCIPVMPCGPFY